MGAKLKHDSSPLSLMEAVETLSNIVEFDWEMERGEEGEKKPRKPTDFTQWFDAQNFDENRVKMREIFKVILHHLRDVYNKKGPSKDPKTIEGIKTIMVLVGEAAKKLDKYTTLFHQVKNKSITDLKEYKNLQEFYLRRIARKIDDTLLSRWVFALVQRAWSTREGAKVTPAKKPIEATHVFVDLDSVKKDLAYELFFLRKEDGSRFFSSRLLRNIKLVCDFGEQFGRLKKEIDPLEDLDIWRNQVYQGAAKNILSVLSNRIDRFYREAIKFKDRELVELENKALMALMLSAMPHNYQEDVSSKNCRDYFIDFQMFLRQAIASQDYQKLIVYPSKHRNKLSALLLDILSGLCLGFFTELQPDFLSNIHHLVNQAHETRSSDHEKAAQTFWGRLANDYAALTKYLKGHPNGHLTKILDALQNGDRLSFDPLFQQNLPSQNYALRLDDVKISHLRLPSPTLQEYIHKAAVTDEFKNLVRICCTDHTIEKILLINLQDRTSWREHARAIALEELQHLEEINKHLTVVSLTKDTEFYQQLAPYHADNHAHVFLEHFKEHLSDNQSGFYFPEQIRSALFPHFVDGVLDTIHRIFFSNKNILLREHRQDFIEIFYLFLQLKLIELVNPGAFCFTCKDGVDISSCSSAQLYMFLKIINNAEFNLTEKNNFDLMLYSPAILERERVVLPERFNRMISALRTIESAKDHLGKDNFAMVIRDAFGDFFKTDILHATPVFPAK